MRVMLDTNILISAFLFRNREISRFFDKLSKTSEIVVCSYVVDEVREVIQRKFPQRIGDVEQFLGSFPFTMIVSPRHIEKRLFEIRDPFDYIILHTAIVNDVDILITGDKDFDELKTQIKKPVIMSMREFLKYRM